MTRVHPEAERDQYETPFTAILRRLYRSLPGVLSAAFVDEEGECIDYVSSLDPFEAKVAAAHMFVVLHGVVGASRLGLREPYQMEVGGSERECWVRRIGGDYVLVVMLEPGFDRSALAMAVAACGREFRAEAGLDAPLWEPRDAVLEVEVRSAVGWSYAPSSFNEDGMHVGITDVLGRWTESGEEGQEELVCFRVRTESGKELTLVHDPDGDGWLVRV